MVVRISELKLPCGHSNRELEQAICRTLGIHRVKPGTEYANLNAEAGSAAWARRAVQSEYHTASGCPEASAGNVPEYEIIHRSIDARKKPSLFYVYTIDVCMPRPQAVVRKLRNRHVTAVEPTEYRFPYEKSRQPALGQASRPEVPGHRFADPAALPEKTASKSGFVRPVIVGSGPAGLFCALMLARAGLCPILLERGESVEKRTETVAHFWKTGELRPNSNVQFGEGGAGTFSDGKLNTLIKDPDGKIRFVLREFVRAGANPSILTDHKPHIGTDVLVRVVRHLREEICALGGTVRFESLLTRVSCVAPEQAEYGESGANGNPAQSRNSIFSANYAENKDDISFGDFVENKDRLTCGNYSENKEIPTFAQPLYRLEINHGEQYLETDTLVLAIGHSARETFVMLERFGLKMEPKAFAAGLRIEHPQSIINDAMYGREDAGELGAAPYKLTHKCENGRGVYSFCMCPGGYVVNASSEQGLTAVNGMSYSGRDSQNANSAIVVTVRPEDYLHWTEDTSDSNNDFTGALSGIAFQRQLERAAYACGEGRIPVQRFEDFRENRPSAAPGAVIPETRGDWKPANLRSVLPEELNQSLIEGIEAFGRRIPGFDSPDALLAGVESRTSSPVRILRTPECQSERFPGIFPCGEGAGYAGGITSAAVDGIRVAEAVCRRYPLSFR